MQFQELMKALLPFLIMSYLLWRFVAYFRVRQILPRLLDEGAIVIDVRSSSEFQKESRPGSINIPLNELKHRCQELNPEKTIVVCCASGARSGIAVGILKKNGFSHVFNAGSWKSTMK